MTAPAWSPDQPLRADATNEQIHERAYWLYSQSPPSRDRAAHYAEVAREFAHAQVAHLCNTTNEELAVWERRYEKLQDELEEARRVSPAGTPALTDKKQVQAMTGRSEAHP